MATYTAKSGDNLFKIAEQLYGDQRMAYEIARINGGSFLVRPGDRFDIPAYNKNLYVSKGQELAAEGKITVNGQNLSGLANPPGAGGSGYTVPTAPVQELNQRGNSLYGDLGFGVTGITPKDVLQEDVFWTQRGSTPQYDINSISKSAQGVDGQLAGGMGMNVGGDRVTGGSARRGRSNLTPLQEIGQTTFVKPLQNIGSMLSGIGQRINEAIPATQPRGGIMNNADQVRNLAQTPYAQQASAQAVQERNANIENTIANREPYVGRITELRIQQQAQRTQQGEVLNAQFALGARPETVPDKVLSSAMPNVPKDFQAAAMFEAGYTYKDGVWYLSGNAPAGDNEGNWSWKDVFPQGMDAPVTRTSSGTLPNTRNLSKVPMNPYYTAASMDWRIATG